MHGGLSSEPTALIEQVAEDSSTFVLPEDRVGGLSLMLLYTEPTTSYRLSAVTR